MRFFLSPESKISPDGIFHISFGHNITDIAWHADSKVEGDPLCLFPNMNVCSSEKETEEKDFFLIAETKLALNLVK